MIDCGTVAKSKSNKGQSVVKVNLLGRLTEWLPVLQEADSFKRKYRPIRKGTQVIVLANRYVVGALFNQDCSEPDGANDHIDITEYEDGTRIKYDTKIKVLTVIAAGDVKIKTKGNAEIDAGKEAKVTAPLVNIDGDAGDVKIGGISHMYHTHPQKNGNHFGGDVSTGTPQ